MNKNPKLYRQVAGALLSTIYSHGPIHKKFVSSATKRIIGNLNKLEQIQFPDEPIKECLITFLADQYRLLKLHRINIKKIQDPNKQAHVAGKMSEIRYSIRILSNILKKFSHDAKAIADTHGD